MGKRKFVCSGCKRIEYISEDKIRIDKDIGMEFQIEFISEINRLQAKRIETRFVGDDIEFRINITQLFAELCKKFDINKIVSFCFYQVVKNIAESHIDPRLIKGTPENIAYSNFLTNNNRIN